MTSLLGNREKAAHDRSHLNGSMDLQLRYQGSAQAGETKLREKVVRDDAESSVKKRKPVGHSKKKKSIQSTDFSQKTVQKKVTDEQGDSSFMTRSQNLRMAQNMSEFDCSLHIIAPPNAYNGRNCDDMMDMDPMDDGAEDDENENGASSTILRNSGRNNLEKPHYSVISNAE